jgi:hypothetical protein
VLTNNSHVSGDTFFVSESGNHDFGDGSMAFLKGERIIFNGSKWDKAPDDGSTGDPETDDDFFDI